MTTLIHISNYPFVPGTRQGPFFMSNTDSVDVVAATCTVLYRARARVKIMHAWPINHSVTQAFQLWWGRDSSLSVAMLHKLYE